MNERLAAAVPVLIGALVLLVQPLPASSAEDEVLGTDDPQAVELLNRSATAASRVSYQGTQYVSAWSALTKTGASASAVVQVRHRAGGPTEIGVQDTQKAILQSRSGTSWLAEDGTSVDLLIDAYEVRVAGEAQVASRMTDVVEARRADGSLAARWWLDQQTSLALRREAFMPDGRLLSASAFVEISLVPAPSCCLRSTIEAAVGSVGYDQAALQWDDIERLRGEGFHCLDSLGADVVLYEARELGDAIHLSYSDGIMTVSVFEQPGRLDPEQLEDYTTSQVGDGIVYSSPGPPARFVWSSGGRVITVLADAPLEVIDDIVRAVPPDGPAAEKEDGGFLSRIGRGAQKVGSWVNPFD